MRRNKFFFIRGLAGTHLENSIIDFNAELMRQKFTELFFRVYSTQSRHLYTEKKQHRNAISLWPSFTWLLFKKRIIFHRLFLFQRRRDMKMER